MPANATRIAPCVGGCGALLECKVPGRDRSCSDCSAARKRRYRADYYKANGEKERQRSLSWFADNRERSIKASQDWKTGNRQKVRDYKNRRNLDPAERLNGRMRVGINQRLRDGKGGRSWREIVGYGPEELMAHLERQFLPGMTWENVGEWHVDHIVPLVTFQYECADSPEFRRAWALSNLRPLWGKDNRKKWAKRTHLI